MENERKILERPILYLLHLKEKEKLLLVQYFITIYFLLDMYLIRLMGLKCLWYIILRLHMFKGYNSSRCLILVKLLLPSEKHIWVVLSFSSCCDIFVVFIMTLPSKQLIAAYKHSFVTNPYVNERNYRKIISTILVYGVWRNSIWLIVLRLYVKGLHINA